MTWGNVAGAAISVVGGAIASDSASSAANAGSEAAQAANMQQMMAQQQMRSDLQPWVETGRGANSLLSRYLGVGGVGSSGRTSLGLGTGLNPTELRNQLIGRYTSTRAGDAGPDGISAAVAATPAYQRLTRMGVSPTEAAGLVTQNGGDSGGTDWRYSAPAGTSTVDEAGLQAAMDQYYREQEAQNAQAQQDPTYGSLLRAYRGGAEFDSGPAFSFTGADLANEPGYKFGLDQGTQGIERGQAARGNFLSGAAMKELNRFNQDYAGTKFNEGFNRARTTYGTNLSRRQDEWNTNLNAYNSNRDRIYNYLTGASSTGQASAARVGSANQQTATQVGNNIMGAGNMHAAADIAGGNALASSLNRSANAFNTSNPNSAAGWNSLISGIKYGGSSNNPYAANYENQMDRGY